MRAQDLRAAGVAASTIARSAKAGAIIRVAQLPDIDVPIYSIPKSLGYNSVDAGMLTPNTSNR